MALLGEHVESKSVPLKIGAIVGLGIAYVGSQREALSALLLPIVADEENSMEIASLASLALGLVFLGSCNSEIAATILQARAGREMSTIYGSRSCASISVNKKLLMQHLRRLKQPNIT